MSYLPWHSEAFLDLWSRRDRLPHALLLHGRAGIGKHAFATALARGILCEQPGTAGACGACASCGWFESGHHPDLLRLEPDVAETAAPEEGEAKAEKKKPSVQITVEQVRGVADFLTVSAHRGGWRPILLHPTEALNTSAANALLKNLEEPPARTLFILVTHRLNQVLPTLKSRCQLVALRAPARAEAAAWLEAEGVAEAPLALAHSGGAPLRATELPVANYWELRRRLMRHLCDGRLDPLAAADDALEAGVPLVLEWLHKWTYDLALRRLAGEIRYNVDQRPALERLAASAQPLPVLRFHREISRLQRHAHHPLNARLVLEQLFMNYADVLSATRTTR